MNLKSSGIRMLPTATGLMSNSGEYDSLLGRSNDNTPKSVLQAAKKVGIVRTGKHSTLNPDMLRSSDFHVGGNRSFGESSSPPTILEDLNRTMPNMPTKSPNIHPKALTIGSPSLSRSYEGGLQSSLNHSQNLSSSPLSQSQNALHLSMSQTPPSSAIPHIPSRSQNIASSPSLSRSQNIPSSPSLSRSQNIPNSPSLSSSQNIASSPPLTVSQEMKASSPTLGRKMAFIEETASSLPDDGPDSLVAHMPLTMSQTTHLSEKKSPTEISSSEDHSHSEPRLSDIQLRSSLLAQPQFVGGDDFFKANFFLGLKDDQTHNPNKPPEDTDAGLLPLINTLGEQELLALAGMAEKERVEFLNSKALPTYKVAEPVGCEPDQDFISSTQFAQNLAQFSNKSGELKMCPPRAREEVCTIWAQLSTASLSIFSVDEREPISSILFTPETEVIPNMDTYQFSIDGFIFQTSSEHETLSWVEECQKVVRDTNQDSHTHIPTVSLSVKAYYICPSVNSQQSTWLQIVIRKENDIVCTILRSMAQLHHLHERLQNELCSISFPKIPNGPATEEDLPFYETIGNYLNELTSHHLVQINLAFRAFLSTLPTDLGRKLVEIRLRKVQDFFLEGSYNLEKVVATLCLVNQQNERVSVLLQSQPSNTSGEWNQNFYFNLSNKEIGGILLQLHSHRKHPYCFGNIFIPRSSCIYRRIDHTFPIHPTSAYPNVMHGIVQMELKLITHSDFILPRIPERVAYDQPEFKQARERERKISQQRIAGHITLSYTYYPPTTHHQGAFFIKLHHCSNLDSKDANGKSDPYVCFEIVENGLRHCFILLDTIGNKYKPKKFTDQSPLERLGALTRSKTIKETLDPVYNETFLFVIQPHEPCDPFYLDINVWDYDRVGGDDFIGNHQIFEPDIIPAMHYSEVELPLSGIFTEDDVPKKVGHSFKERGFSPKYPIVLIPGFCSSGLKVVSGDKHWVNERIWLSLTKLTGETKAARALRFHSAKPVPSKRLEKKHSVNPTDPAPKKKGSRPLLLKKNSTGNPYFSPPPSFMSNELFESSDTLIEEEEAWAREPEYKNRWLKHMCLDKDGYSDQQGISLRPVAGTEGIAYLAPGKLTNALSYVMGPLIENLKAVGYEEGKNLFAASYDWRIPPHYNEERDHYFSNLAKEIEKLVNNNELKHPVCLIAHSMGNRTAQYFLNYAETHLGRGWLDRHIREFIAVGAPFLGAPKSVRGLCSGERLGLETFLSEQDGLTLARSIGSTPFLFPVGCSHYFDKNLHGDTSFMYVHDPNHQTIQSETSNKIFEPKTLDFCLRDSGAERQLYQFDDYYLKNPLFGGPHEGDAKILAPPPIKRLTCIYGINLHTEVKYFFKKGEGRYHLKSPPDKSRFPVFKISGGTAFETELTPQPAIKKFSGIDGTKSGDGTVPYASLNFPEEWRDCLDHLEMIELYGAEHREILNNRMLFYHIIQIVAQNPVEQKEEALSFFEKSQWVDHNFKRISFKTPTYCKFCSRFIWGVYKQGYECSQCLYPAHKGCYVQVGPTCTSQKPSFLDQTTDKFAMGKNRFEKKPQEIKSIIEKELKSKKEKKLKKEK